MSVIRRALINERIRLRGAIASAISDAGIANSRVSDEEVRDAARNFVHMLLRLVDDLTETNKELNK